MRLPLPAGGGESHVKNPSSRPGGEARSGETFAQRDKWLVVERGLSASRASGPRPRRRRRAMCDSPQPQQVRGLGDVSLRQLRWGGIVVPRRPPACGGLHASAGRPSD